MDLEHLRPYFLPAAVAAYFGWRYWSFRRVKARLPELLKRGGVVVDVRSPAEYAGGARPGSLNIPVSELQERCKGLDKAKPVIVCCASGTRSALAARVLKALGFQEVVNAGPWTNVLDAD
ncbi:MAG: rhodanese-like domain-containing protein [Elusimicrobia bacterium]|nr:rhodanese-like domain-containing protein [Elusimicrobiota bacterium]